MVNASTNVQDAENNLGSPLNNKANSFVHSHPTFREGVQNIVPWKSVIFVFVVTLASSLAVFFVVEEEDLQCLRADDPDTTAVKDYAVGSRVSACNPSKGTCFAPGQVGSVYEPAFITDIFSNNTALLRWDSAGGDPFHGYLIDLKGTYADGEKWPMMIIAVLLILFVSLVLSGAPPELTLFFCGAVAVLAGALDADELYQGTASTAVVTLALLFPIMKAMADTGIPDIFIGFMMGQPKTLPSAIVRMFFPVALLSGFFNNTPIVVMMIPLVMTFCQRLNLDHRAMLMPLSYAGQAGGSLTLMGTSVNFVAREVFSKGGFQIGFFTLTLGGIIILVLDIVYCAVMGPIILATKPELPEATEADNTRNSAGSRKRAKSMQEVQEELGKKNLFSVAILITPGSPLIGSAIQDCGIHRIKGVHIVHRIFRHEISNNEMLATVPVTGSVVQLEESLAQWEAKSVRSLMSRGDSSVANTIRDNVDDVESAESQTDMISQYQLIAEGWDDVSAIVVKNQDVLQVAGTSEGIAELRQVRGLVLGNEHTELQFLGGRRRQRVLCEAAVVPELVGKQIDIREWKSYLRCGVIGIRSVREPSLCRLSYQGYTVQEGDVLLIEAFKNMLGSDVWLENFGVVRQVPGSAPPRNGRKADFFRAIFTGIGLLLVISLATLSSPILTMPVMCTIFLIGILAARGLTVAEAYAEINAPVLFTIVGALGLGQAMQQTRLANCLAGVIVGLVQDGGPFAVLVGLYVATVGVGQFLNSAANVAIMGAIGIPIANQMGMDLGSIALVIIYAASACYMAPYGYQTNTLVIKDGGYTWGDFAKFGGGLQFVHLIVVVSISQFCANHAM